MFRTVKNRARQLTWQISSRLNALYGARYLRQGRVDFIELDITKFAYMGFGASIGWLQAAYIACDALDARLTVLNPDKWPFGGSSPSCAMDRFILFPEADQLQHGIPGALPIESNDFGNLAKWGYYDALDRPTCLFGYRPDSYPTLEAYRRAVFARFYQPTTFTLSNIKPKLAALPDRYVAWHLRRGDKTSGVWREDKPVELEAYFRATLDILLMDPNAPRNVVVCTDDTSILEEVMAFPETRTGQLKIIYDDQEKRWNGYCALQRQGKIIDSDEMVAEVLTAQKLIEIFRHSEYLVGCNSSCLFRVGALLKPDGARVVSLSENKVFKKYYPI